MSDKTFLLLGGAGLVGMQVARRIAHEIKPERIVLAALTKPEIDRALDGPTGLRQIFRNEPVEFVGEWGDLFVRTGLKDQPRSALLQDESQRKLLFADLHDPLEETYANSRLVELILKHRPEVIVDSVNTATGISYQDFSTLSNDAKAQMDQLFGDLREGRHEEAAAGCAEAERLFESLILSASVPQLIRHVLLLNRAMREVGTRLYLKVGTTGTGGMGLNIPYTHSEDKPSAKLLTKSAIAFAQTGLLFLMARTVGGPIVKEIKPGAMIGYADIARRQIRSRGEDVAIYSSRTFPLDSTLERQMSPAEFEELGKLELPVVDTGENGLFTRGEFEAITSLRQMEYLTPEEIALECYLEIRGSNTGRDVIAAIDGAVMSSSYRAGVLRQRALDDLEKLEREEDSHSVALGQLGPPELSKLLWEAELLKLRLGSIEKVLAETPESLSRQLYELIQENPRLQQTINAIGVPILTPDHQLIRGPLVKIPENHPQIPLGDGQLDRWADKGWVDLRPSSFERWQQRFRKMKQARERLHMKGSAAVTRDAYLFDEIQIGSVVAWIFNNEEKGYRIK